jgi:hypothetical protein
MKKETHAKAETSTSNSKTNGKHPTGAQGSRKGAGRSTGRPSGDTVVKIAKVKGVTTSTPKRRVTTAFARETPVDDYTFWAYDNSLDEFETKTWPLYTVVAVVFVMGVGVGAILGWII